jgi:hypothetical protein
MDAAGTRQQIEAVVQRFSEIAPSGWARLVGNWEAARDGDGNTVLNYLTLAVVDGTDRWLYGQVGYDEPLYDLVVALNDASPKEGADDGPDRRWTVFDLEVDADGSYRTEFGYDPPKRSNGIMDEESLGRFESYLEGWMAEHGAIPAGGR